MADPGPAARHGSFRTSGSRNIAISMVVAALSYLSLTLVARRFGGSIGSDAYFFLFSFSTVASGLISSIFATVFLPLFVETRLKAGDTAAAEFAGVLLGYSFVIVAPVALLSYLFYFPFFSLVTRYTPEQLTAIRPVLILFSAVFFFSVLAEYYRAIVLALGHFALAALGALFQPVLLIGATVLLSDRFQEQSLALSLVAARVCTLALMIIVVRACWRMPVRLNLHWSATARRFVATATPYWSATMVTNFALFYFDYVATGLGAGVLSAIAYAQRIFALPTTIILTPLLDIARTRFSEFRARGDNDGFLDQHNKLTQFVIYFSIPIAAIFFFFPVEIISSMFQRGAFGAESVRIASDCLRVLALSIPFSCVFMLNGRAAESFQRLLWPSVFGTIGNLLVIVATYQFSANWGYLGIPLAKLAMDLFYFFPFGFIALRLFSGQVRLTRVAGVVFFALIGAILPGAMYRLAGIDALLVPHFPSIVTLGLLLGGFIVCYASVVATLDRRFIAALLRART
jgi:putative peptidoglycan lipid II flippase